MVGEGLAGGSAEADGAVRDGVGDGSSGVPLGSGEGLPDGDGRLVDEANDPEPPASSDSRASRTEASAAVMGRARGRS